MKQHIHEALYDVPRETEINSVQLFLDDVGVEKAQGITRP
jgi:hypothetical protein